MNQQPIPDPELVKKTVRELRALCRQFDLLNFQLDELTAYVDAEIRKSPLTAYRLGKNPQQMDQSCLPSKFKVGVIHELPLP